jgi:cytochrome c biogenesis protein CcdA
VKGDPTTRPDRWPALLLAAGFTLTATATFAGVWALGAGLLGQWRSSPAVWLAATAVLAVLLAADTGLFGLRTPMWRRQTPKWFMFRFSNRMSAFLWGIDAGLVGTTFRVTSLSWAALTLTFAGMLPWWAGALYAAGFAIPELTAMLVVPRRSGQAGAVTVEPTWLVDRLHRILPTMRPVGQAVLVAAGAWTILLTVVNSI